MTWQQIYRDNGLKWEKVVSVKPPAGIDALFTAHYAVSTRHRL